MIDLAKDSNEAGPGAEAEARARARRRVLGVGVVALVALLQLTTQYLGGQERAKLLSNMLFLSIEMPILLGLLSVGFRVATERRWSTLTMVVGATLFTGIVSVVLGTLVWGIASQITAVSLRSDGPWRLPRAMFIAVTYGQLYCGVWALAFVVPFAVEDARVRALEADKLRLEAEKLRAAAELARLRAHLEPHFLLNTLNAIAGLVTEDPREARRLLACLGDLLRDALRDEDELEPLEQQIAWLRRYAAILEARHSGSLVFRWDVPADSGGVVLPRLLLQPLVENAVKHGALRRAGGGEVIVRARVDGGRVRCEVEDNGPGVASETRSGAFGLESVRRRLALRYAERASVRLESSSDGTRAIVEVAAA
ncbi:MAG: histidine kinase [Polyangiaceae bacterium]